MTMVLIENWRKAWRMFSVQAMALAVAVQALWESGALQDVVPAAWVPRITIGLLVFGIVGRVVCQPKAAVPGQALPGKANRIDEVL